MDNTFYNTHVSDNFEAIVLGKKSVLPIGPKKIIIVAPPEDHFLKGIFKKITKSVVKKTAAKAGVDASKLQTQLDTAIANSDVGKKINRLNTAGNIVAGAGLAALTAGLATGAIPLAGAGAATVGTGSTIAGGAANTGGAIAGAGGLAGAGAGLKKVLAKSSVKDKITDLANKLPESVKQNIANKGEQFIQDVLGNQTSQELLPKNKSQKLLENQIRNNQAQSALGSTGISNQTMIISAVIVVMLILAAILKK